jgi:hypothetical protein
MKNREPIAKTATAALVQLWRIGFFRTWHTRGAVDAKLAKSGYHFSGPELGMALKRARHLTRKGSRGNYHYIQKYPFTRDEGDDVKKQKVGKRI